jgi:hypothetical protein
MTKLLGSYNEGVYKVLTPLNAVTATTTSSAIPVMGAKRVVWQFTRANHAAGSTAFTVDVSLDGSTWIAYNKLISNVTNTNAQTLTRVASVSLSSDTSSFVTMDLEHDAFIEMRVTATETTDGTHTAKCLIIT